jgi:hypothetical protein
MTAFTRPVLLGTLFAFLLGLCQSCASVKGDDFDLKMELEAHPDGSCQSTP